MAGGNDPYLEWNGLRFKERAINTPKFSFSDDSNRCVRLLMVPWGSDTTAIWNAAKALLAYPTLVAPDPAYPKFCYFSRPLPLTHPNFPGFFFATSIQEVEGIIPKGMDVNCVNSFDEAWVTVIYEAPIYQHMNDQQLVSAIAQKNGPANWFPDEASLLRMVTPDQQSGGRWQTLPSYTTLRFQSTNPLTGAILPPNSNPDNDQAVTNTLTVLLEDSDITITWHNVPVESYPISAIKKCRGKTNRFPLGHPNSYFGGWPAYTLQMLAPKLKPHRGIANQQLVDIGYRFKYFPNGANFFYNHRRKPSPGYSIAYLKPDRGNPPNQVTRFFQPENFNNLFRPEGFFKEGLSEPTYGQDLSIFNP